MWPRLDGVGVLGPRGPFFGDVCLVFRYAFGTKDVMNLLLLIIGIIWNYLIISGFSKDWYLYGFKLITVEHS